MIELKSSHVPTFVKRLQGQILVAGLLLLSSSSVLLLSGCSSAFNTGSSQPLGSVEITGTKGIVHGGQAPVTSSTVQIYEVSAAGAGYGAAATPVQQSGSTVTTSTDGNGNWSYPTYTCLSSSDYLYVVSTGGDAGDGTNGALAETAALGQCSNIANVGFVYINEVTTVATAYSLAGFMTNYSSVATSSGNAVGLANAFATFNNLVDLNNGLALKVTPAYATAPTNTTPDVFRSIVPYDTINTLADALAGCVNSDGTGSACTTLFGVTGNAGNTSDAVLYIAHHPSLGGAANLATLVGLATPSSPFQPTLTSTPNDLTLTLNFTSGGLGGVNSHSASGAGYIAIDGSGNVWIPNSGQVSVSELNNLGAPLSPTTTVNGGTRTSDRPIALGGWGAATSLFGEPEEVAIDQSGNAWITDDLNCLIGLSPTGGALSGAPYSVCGGKAAQGIAIDGSNNVWVSGGQFISAANNSGTALSGFPVTSGFDSLIGYLGADYLGNVWYIDQGNNHFGALKNTGALYVASADSDLSSPDGFAAFGAGETLFIPENGGTDNVQPVNALSASINTIPTAFIPNSEGGGGTGIAVDGGNNVYLAVQGGGIESGCTTDIPPNLTVTTHSGTLISPSCNGYVGGSALTALLAPQGVAVDQSGNVWVVNTSNGNPTAPGQLGNGSGAANVTEFVGLAAPSNPVYSKAALLGASGSTTPGAYGERP
ncbi:MAG: hypothetical protein ABR956_06845 [Terracidiphilus sp.]